MGADGTGRGMDGNCKSLEKGRVSPRSFDNLNRNLRFNRQNLAEELIFEYEPLSFERTLRETFSLMLFVFFERLSDRIGNLHIGNSLLVYLLSETAPLPEHLLLTLQENGLQARSTIPFQVKQSNKH
jgi:hypothetical protein